MATIVLSAAGAALGGKIGGGLIGLSGAALGRALGATLGRAIDQRIFGSGAQLVETGRIERLRLQSAGEGVPVPRIWGQMRLSGHIIWASPVEEFSRSESRGKGARGAAVRRIGYRLSVAVALCAGQISGVGRVWADGQEIAASALNMRVYPGDDAQLPDPLIAALEGDEAPGYRGVAYVVLEDLDLSQWGNRMPVLSFEVTRPAQAGGGLSADVTAVAMIPGCGEYALATTPVTQDLELGEVRSVNVNTPMGGTDFTASLDVLGRELPRAGGVSLVVSWFGDDLRIGQCSLRPKVEYRDADVDEMPWRAGGIGRAEADEVVRADGRPVYGGTPCDQSVVEALRAIAASGRRAVFYPFILMEQLQDNGLADPYGREAQPVMPWRGRITTSVAAGLAGSPDGTEAARAEVAAFFGDAAVQDFSRDGGVVSYHGPEEWSYRRFILHYAHLCAEAGGVDAFLIGSEMVAMTQIRDAQGYPAVAELRRLAADVRQILEPDVKISYAADWSEYSGHNPGDGERFFHLDPLWADENINFIGIDNYMPLSDWRDGTRHLDAHWGRIDNPAYLRAGVAGGEGFDWYYASDSDRDAQIRTPINDGAYDEPWVWRYKDIKSWWENLHYERPGGVRSADATAWVPGSKPVWFTELGCAALNKATNQPNKFLDAMSSESALPYFSNGQRDDALQAAYLRAVMSHWQDPAHNPVMTGGGRMVDLDHAYVWCWDARPYPAFPARRDLWSDGPAWERGHWLNGRAGAVPLASVVADICQRAGVAEFDVSGLSGLVRGYLLTGHESGRAALQPLMLAHGFDAVERDGVLGFIMRDGVARVDLDAGDLALAEDLTGFEVTRGASAEIAGRLRLSHVEAGGDYGIAASEAVAPGGAAEAASETEFPMLLTRAESRRIAERWLAEAEVARDTARFALPPSRSQLGPGDVVRMHHEGAAQLWRIDRMGRSDALLVDAVRVDPGLYHPADEAGDTPVTGRYVPPLPVWPVFLDLPLLRGDEVPHAPYLAATASPWSGSVAAFMSGQSEGGYALNLLLEQSAVIGRTLSHLPAARSGMTDRGPALQVQIKAGRLQSVGPAALLAGANILAIGDGTGGDWEVMQFAHAEMVANGIWEISGRLRGQAGTDGIMPLVWPVGSVVVLLDEAPEQVRLSPTLRGQLQYWRIGPALRAPDDPSYRSVIAGGQGIGLRPYAPCHLRLRDGRVSWVRRARLGGDDWNVPEIGLDEQDEAYHLRLKRGGEVIHQLWLSRPEYQIPAHVRAAGPTLVEVAQHSAQFGTGPFIRREIYDV